MLFQCIEIRGVFPFSYPASKVRLDFFFIGIFSIVGMILAKIVDRAFPTGRSPSFWKLSPQLVDSDKREADAA